MASKGTINLQLNIDTQFKNVNTAVANFQKALSNIKIDNNFLNVSGIANTFQTQIEEIQKSLSQASTFELSGSSLNEYQDLLKSIQNQYSSLKSSVTDYQVALNNSKDAIQAQITQETQAADAAKKKADNLRTQISEIVTLKAAQEDVAKTGREATEEEKALAEKYKDTNTNLKSLRASLGHANKDYNEHNQKLQELLETQKSYESIGEQIIDITKKTGDEIKTATNARKEEVEVAKQESEAQRAAARAAEEKAKADAKAAEAEREALEASKQRVAVLEQDTNSTLIEYQKVTTQGAAATDSLSSALESSIIKWGSFTAIVRTAISAIKDIVSTYQELDDNLSAISAVSGIATESLWGDMPQMIDNANKLALSVDDLTNGMLLFYQQGLSTEETEIRLNAAGKMAAISQQDLSTAVDQLTSTMNAFNMTGEDAQNVVDVFANMAGKTATDVEELATAMARTASIAKNAGMTFEQTTAFIATMEETTRLSAETIGNSMKSIIARFQKLKEDPDSLLEDGVNANDVEKALKKADVALRDTEGNFRNIGDVIMELSAKWDTLDTNTQKYIATMAAGTQQSSNFIALVSNYQSNVDNLAYAMDSAGAAEEQFQAVGNNLSAALQRLDNNFTALKTSFLEDTGALTAFINVLAGFVDILAKIPGPIKTIAIVTAAWTLVMAKHNLQVQKKVASARQEMAIEIQSYAQKIKNAQGNDAEFNAIIENVEAHAKLTAAVKGLNEVETEALVTKAKSIVMNTKQIQSIDEITKKLNKGSTSLMNYSVEGKTVTSVFASMGESIGGVAGSLVKAIPYVGAVIGVLSVVNAVLKSIFGIDIVGSIEDWIKNGVEKFRDSIDHSLKHTTEKLENFKEEIKSLKDESKELDSTLSTIKDYSDRLQEAHDNNESLDSLRQEILDNIDSEKLGIDTLTASYEDLTEALENYYKIQQQEADKKVAEYIREQTEANKTTQDYYKNQTSNYIETDDNGPLSGKAYVGKDGKQIYTTDFLAEYNGNKENDEDYDTYAKRMGYTIFTSPKYAIQTIDGQWNYYDTAEEAKEALNQLEADATKIILNQNEADALVRDALTNNANSSVAELDPTVLSLAIQSYYKNIGSAFETGTNTFTQDFLDFQNSVTQLSTDAGVTLQDALNYLNGNFDQLSTDTIQKIQDISSSENEALQQAIDSQTQAYQDSIDQLRTSLNEQGVILDEDTAEEIGLGPLRKIQEVAESAGPKVANELIKLYDDNFNNILNKIEIDPDSLDGVKEQLENAVGDLADDLDLSNLSEAFSELLNSYLDGSIDSTQFLMALQAISSGSTDAAENLSGLVSVMQQVTAASQDSFTSMESVSQTWSDFGTNLGYIQQLASDTGISLDQLKSVAEALGMTIDEIIASANLTQIGTQFFANAENADTLANSLVGLTDSQLAQAQAEQEAASANAEAAAAQARSSATVLNAKADEIEAYAGTHSAMNSLIPANSELMKSAIDVAKAQKELNVQMEAETPAVNDLTSSAKTTSVTYGELAAKIRAYASELEASADKEDAAKVAADAKASYISNLRTQLQSAKKDWQNYGKSASSGSKGSGGGGGGSSAADNVNEATEALEEQKKALQEAQKELEKYKQQLEDAKKALEEQKSALEETNKKLQENYKLYVELIKSRLNDEIDRQTTRIEAFYGAIKDTIQSEIDSFNDQLDALKKQADELKSKADELQDAADQQEDSLNKLYDAAQAYYDAAQDGLDNQIDSYDKVIDRNKEHIDLLNEQKDAIQDQIDALDTAADSESKLLALEKARDALANARNQKTRMVLTNGGGWRLRTDKSEISNAQSNLASAQRDYQKEILERQQKKIEEQTDEIEKQNDNLENIKSDLEDQKDALDDIKDQWDKAQDALGKTTSELEEQTNLIRQFQYGNDTSRQDQLSNFSGQVSNNNQQQQAASDATNRANEASNKYDQQSNEDVQGSIAEAIKKLEEQQNQADEALKKYFENQLSNNAETAQIQQEMKDLINQMVNGQIGQLENFAQFYETINGALEQANTNASQTADYINNINAAIDRYDEWSNRLDMTTDEINQRQAIMNEINNATLGSLLEGGSTFGQLQGQYEQIVRNNDEAEKIQDQIDGLDEQANIIQAQIDALKEQENKIAEQEKELSNANSNKTANAAKAAGNTAASGAKTAGLGIQANADKNTNRMVSALDGLNSKIEQSMKQAAADAAAKVVENSSKGFSTLREAVGGPFGKSGSGSKGTQIGFSQGGVDDFTKTVAIHGTKNRPELVLNNSQSAALFKYIDSMTRIPTLSTAGSARNALMGFGATNNTNNNGTNFTNCEFNVESNADNLDSLVQDLKQSASIRR